MKHFEINAIKDCKWCVRAANLAYDKDCSYSYIVRDKEWFKGQGFATAPQIYVREGVDFSLYRHIGGYEDLDAYFKSV